MYVLTYLIDWIYEIIVIGFIFGRIVSYPFLVIMIVWNTTQNREEEPVLNKMSTKRAKIVHEWM